MPAPSRGSLLIVFLVVFIDLLGFGIVLPLLPRYGEEYQATDTALGLLMASFSAMQFFFAPIWGRVSDRIGRRPVLILGLAGSVVFYGLFGFATSFRRDELLLGLTPLTWLFIARIGAGIAGPTIPTAQAYIADVTDAKNRGKGMALIGAGFGMGFTFGPLLAAAFASKDPGTPPSPYAGYLASGLSAMALIGAIFRLPESLRPGTQSAHRQWLSMSMLGRVMRSPMHRGIIFAIFLSTFAFAQFESTLSLLTERLGMSERRNFFVFAYLGFMLLICQGLFVRRLMPVVGEKRMALAGAFLLAVGLGLVGWSAGSATHLSEGQSPGNALIQLMAVLPAAVAGFSAMTPSLQSLLSLNTSQSEQGEILGMAQSVSAMARILGPFTGIVIFFRGGPQSPYWTAAAMMILAAGCVAALGRNAVSADNPLPTGDPADGVA